MLNEKRVHFCWVVCDCLGGCWQSGWYLNVQHHQLYHHQYHLLSFPGKPKSISNTLLISLPDASVLHSGSTKVIILSSRAFFSLLIYILPAMLLCYFGCSSVISSTCNFTTQTDFLRLKLIDISSFFIHFLFHDAPWLSL